MSTLRGWPAGLVVLLLASAVVCVAVIQTPSFEVWAARTVSRWLTHGLAHPVLLGRVQLDAQGATLHQVRVPGIFRADLVRVEWDLTELVRARLAGQSGAAALRWVLLHRPVVFLVRDQRGRWNVEQLFQAPAAPAAAPAERWRAELRVREGTVHLTDQGRGGFRAVFRQVEGRALLEDLPLVRVRAAGDVLPGAPGRFAVSGWVDVREGLLDVAVSFRGLDGPGWAGYLFPDPRWRVQRGSVAGRLRVYGHAASPSVQGSVGLQGVAVHLLREGVRISDVRGEVRLAGPHLFLRALQLRAGSARAVVSGQVRLAGAGAVELDVRFQGAELSVLRRLLGLSLPVQGRLGGELHVQGPVGALRLRSSLKAQQLVVGSHPVEGVAGKLEYGVGVVSLSSAEGRVLGGAMRGDLVANVQGPLRLVAAVELDRVDPSRVPVGLSPPARGDVSGSLLATGPASDPAVAGVLMGRSLELRGYSLDSWRFAFAYRAGNLQVLGARARRGGSSLSGWGALSGGSLDLRVAATGVRLEDVVSAAGLPVSAQGTVDVVGRVGGSWDALQFAGTVFSPSGVLGPFQWEEAVAQVAASPRVLEVAQLHWRRGGDTYRAWGFVDRRTGKLQAQVETGGARVERLLELAGLSLPVTGELRGGVRLEGPLTQPVASGAVDLWDLKTPEATFHRGSGTFRWEAGTLALEHGRLSSEAVDLRVSGAVRAPGSLQLHFAADPVRLELVPHLQNPFLRLEGAVRVEGTVGGSLQQPVLDADVRGTGVRVNGEAFDTVTGRVQWAGHTLEAVPLELRQRASTYTVRGRLELSRDPVVAVLVDVQDARVASLFGMAGLALEADGRLSGRVTLSGPLQSPRAELDVALQDGLFRRYRFPSGTGRLVLEHGRLEVREVELLAGRGQLRAEGSVDLRGQSELEVAGLGLDAGAVSSVLRLRTPLVGTVDFTLQLAGSLQEPTAGLALEARQVGLAGAQVDRVTAQAFYRAGLLEVEQLLVEEDGHRLRGRGRLPLRTQGLDLDPSRPVDFSASTDRADLGILRLLPFVEAAEGPFEAAVKLVGTAAAPQLEGFLRVESGRVKLQGLAPALEGVQLDLTFDQATASLRRLRAGLGDGVVEATGQASFEGLRLHRYVLNATARGARVQVEPYFRGVVDGGVEASGDARRARVAGRVTLSSGELVVAAPPTQAASAGPFPVELDLEMAAGQGLAVVAGPVRLQAGGRLHVGGTLASPALSGTVTARGGEYRAFGTTFVVEEGAAVFQEFRGTEPLLTARASTRVGDVTVFVHLAGTPGQMQVRLTSDPELPYERIVQLLAAHAGIQRALGGEVEAALRQQLARFLLGEFERRVRQLLGLAELRIEYDFEKPLRLRLGRFLLRDLYLTLTTVFDTETRFLWALEYRFARHYAFAFSHDTAGVWMVLLRANFTW